MAAIGFILGQPGLDAQVILLAAASDTIIQTALSATTKYVYPYYQEDADQVIIAEYLGKYGTAYLAASNLWGEMAPQIIAGNLRSLKTGAESTTFISPKEAVEYCLFMSSHYYGKSQADNGASTGQAVGLTGGTIAGGAVQ